ncbi:amino acid permease [Pseudofrancisella aestuarii]|uniref:Amino acid permease n=1 Tax=Pseudofrancisella aestuarii TaxID=2670347 RepID=A0ABV9TBF9_9GAMM|nr:aromatic amino acid transport family protein [Pseudofrancisella aestuarii]
MVSINKQIGCIFLILGTSLGGGILAIPMLLSYFGTIPGIIIMFLVWLLMTYSTLAIAEACMHFERGISFLGLAHKTFGKFGIVLVYICSFGILYGMLTAYIAAIGQTYSNIFNFSVLFSQILFIILFGFFILKGTTHAEWLNRIFLSIKLIIIIFVLALLISQAKLDNLGDYELSNIKELFIVIPVLATTFSAHVIIPTIRNYVGDYPKELRRIILIASFIILAIYSLWVVAIFGNISINEGDKSFKFFLEKDSMMSVSEFLNILKVNLGNGLVTKALFAFIAISVTTAFITLSLSLRDLILDKSNIEKLKPVVKNILLIGLLFGIPIVIDYCFNKIFIMALSIVGLLALIMLVACPLNMVRILRKSGLKLKYKIMENKFINGLALAVSLIIIFLQLLDYLL